MWPVIRSARRMQLPAHTLTGNPHYVILFWNMLFSCACHFVRTKSVYCLSSRQSLFLVQCRQATITFLIPSESSLRRVDGARGGGGGGGWWGDERREEFSLTAVAPGLSGRPQQSALTSTERRDGTRGKGQAFSGWAEEKQWERGNHRQGSDLTEKAVGRGGASSVN